VHRSEIFPLMSVQGQNPNPSRTPAFPLLPVADMAAAVAWQPCADFVAKVFLHWQSKILLAVDATFV
jgi:hypothetical protein